MSIRALIAAVSLAFVGHAMADAPAPDSLQLAQANPQYAPPQANPQYAPQANPQYAPQANPQYAPQANPQYAPQANPQYAPQANPQYAPQARPVAGYGGHLSVRGPEILDPNGNPIILRGWNWGHWGKAQPNDAQDNANQGANVVRLPVRWWGYYQNDNNEARNDSAPAGMDPAHLKMLDDNVRWASQAHLWIILFIDSNCGQNGTQNSTMVQYCDPRHQYPTGHNFFNDPDARARFITLWRFIANRYKDTPYIGMFEPLPEPGTPDTPAAQITAFYSEVTNAIRQVAPGIPFLLGGNRYRPPNAGEAYNPAWHDVVYTANMFLHENGGGGGQGGVGGLGKHFQTLLQLRAQRGVPIFVQQVGVKQGDDPDQAQVRQVLSLLNANHVGFTYWEYRGAQNAETYGVLTQQGKNGGWQSNPNLMNAISQAFRAPR